ncbi:MAG: polysaccharide deacetylase family protein, partial [Sphingomonas bacterium]|nr:polysaccharide deacetylase family protein [Sphingomonas bacterium]
MLNGLSVDVEEWFQVGAFERVIRKADWDGLEGRVDYNTGKVLDLFAESGVKATFFTLGWVADRHPRLIRRIADEGHEVASHGWDHDRVFTLDAAGFRADLARAKSALEDASGQKITGYRAPSFSIDQRTPWAHSVLADEGYRYSSSVAPIAHDHYGWADAPKHAYRPVAGSDLIELPISLASVGGRKIVTGGGFFRLLPGEITYRAITRANRADRPAVFYFHPWDMDPGQPRVANAPIRSKLRHYSRLGAMAGKLRTLVAKAEW